MKCSHSAPNVGLSTFKAAYFIYTHFRVAYSAIIDDAVFHAAAIMDLLSVEEGSKGIVSIINSHRELS